MLVRTHNTQAHGPFIMSGSEQSVYNCPVLYIQSLYHNRERAPLQLLVIKRLKENCPHLISESIQSMKSLAQQLAKI